MDDLQYMIGREKLTRAMSDQPGDIAVQLAHLNLADGYAARIAILAGRPKGLP